MTDTLTNKHGNLVLEIRDDRMSAWLTIKRSGRLIDEREILDLIDNAGIKAGFEDALKYCRVNGLEREFDTPFPVAVCEAVKGDAKLNHYFDTRAAKGFDGHVRPTELSTLTCIEADTVLADYASNIFDRKGSIYNIFGELIQDSGADREHELDLAGQNVCFDETRRQYIAERAGFPSIDEEGRISIVDVLVIEGDLDGEDAILRSPVSVSIQGEARGADIAVRGNVTIQGGLSRSRVYCEGDLSVGGDILACGNPGIEALGSVDCCGIEDSRILCLGTLRFTQDARNSILVAETGINADTEAQGSLIGGHIQTCGNVFLGAAGNADGEETEIEITISPFYKTLLMQLTKELINLKQDSESNAESISALSDKIRRCEEELDHRLNAFLKRERDDKLRVVVRHDVFAPLRIRVLKHDYRIRSHQSGLEVVEKD